MLNRFEQRLNLLPYFFVFFGAALRLLPHPPNFAPIASLALFGAFYLRKKEALWVPLLAMVLSDVFIGFDSIASRLVVYGSFMLATFIGFWAKRNKSLSKIILATFSGSILFYLVTNFPLFYSPIMYSHDWSGIMASYVNAIPFFKNSLFSDLFYTGLLFSSYEFVKYHLESRAVNSSKSLTQND